MNAARDGQSYQGKHVYVVGGADGAVKEALYLAKLAEKVTIIHFEEQLGCIAAVSYTHLDSFGHIIVGNRGYCGVVCKKKSLGRFCP